MAVSISVAAGSRNKWITIGSGSVLSEQADESKPSSANDAISVIFIFSSERICSTIQFSAVSVDRDGRTMNDFGIVPAQKEDDMRDVLGFRPLRKITFLHRPPLAP